MRIGMFVGAAVIGCLALVATPVVVLAAVVSDLGGVAIGVSDLATALPTFGVADIPGGALADYVAAAGYCPGLPWAVLAGIGKVESDHGRYGNTHLAPNGDLVPHIVGVPLTGKNGTSLIETANGDYAHAEGPMQFIPSTWLVWGQDGNGDGIKDVDNIYDATLGAANYLCATSHDLESDDGLMAAYHSYNHSDAYVTEVLAYAKSYQAADAAGLIPPMSPIPLWALAPPTPTSVPGTGVTTTTTLPGAPLKPTTTIGP
jgi:hypothetical protein